MTYILELQNQCSTLFEGYLKEFSNNTLHIKFEEENIHTLSYGIPGICIFYASLDKLYPQEGWDYKAHKHLELLNQNINFNQIDLSLFQGISGVGAAILSLAKENRYKGYLKSLNVILESRAKELLDDFENISSVASRSWESKVSLYDVFSGLSGVVRYMLFFKDDNNNFTQLIKELVYKIIVFVELEIKKPIEKIIDKDDYINIGTAHGLSGLLAILSIVKLEGIEVKNLHSTISKLISFLEENSLIVSGVVTFPEKLPFIGTTKHKTSVNSSWCYGIPGISRSMILASKAINDISLKEKYINNYVKFLESLKLKKGEISTIFCHGLSGIIYEAFLMYKESGEVKFIKHISELLYILHENSDFNKNDPFPDCSVDNKYYKYKEGIVDGSISVYIVLISILLNEAIEMDWIFLKS